MNETTTYIGTWGNLLSILIDNIYRFKEGIRGYNRSDFYEIFKMY